MTIEEVLKEILEQDVKLTDKNFTGKFTIELTYGHGNIRFMEEHVSIKIK